MDAATRVVEASVEGLKEIEFDLQSQRDSLRDLMLRDSEGMRELFGDEAGYQLFIARIRNAAGDAGHKT